MNLTNYDNAIDELRTGKVAEFSPLNVNSDRGRSFDISVRVNSIRFRRSKYFQYANLARMRNVFKKLLDGESFLRLNNIFQHVCEKTFFLQLLKHFKLAEIVGAGTKNNPFNVILL